MHSRAFADSLFDYPTLAQLVMNSPVELSDAQIAAFTNIFKNDERPVQPFNSRTFLVTAATLPATGNPTVRWDGMLIGVGVLMFAAGLALAYVSQRKAV